MNTAKQQSLTRTHIHTFTQTNQGSICMENWFGWWQTHIKMICHSIGIHCQQFSWNKYNLINLHIYNTVDVNRLEFWYYMNSHNRFKCIQISLNWHLICNKMRLLNTVNGFCTRWFFNFEFNKVDKPFFCALLWMNTNQMKCVFINFVSYCSLNNFQHFYGNRHLQKRLVHVFP